MPATLHHLLVRSGPHRCGLPLALVIEVLRPQPIQSWAGAPAFVLGLARVRGEAVPVVDLRRLLGDPAEVPAARFVSLRVGERRISLAVDQVMGLGSIEAGQLSALPPLLAADHPAAQSLARLDPGLLLILSGAQLLPPDAQVAA